MRSLRITGPRESALAQLPIPVVADDALLLAPLAVGLCGTDLEILDGSLVYVKDGRSRLPMTPGHEWVAEVVSWGAAVSGFAAGDRVVGETSIGCNACETCRAGDYHLCPARRETGVMNLDGALAGYLALPARSAHRVPDAMALEDAVFAEPTAVALRAVLRSRCERGDRVLVTGGGTIGWLVVAILRDLLDARVSASEPNPARMQRLTRLGAEPVRDGDVFATVIDASGSPKGTADSLDRLAGGGRLVLVGLTGAGPLPVDLDRIVVGDQSIIGSLGSPNVWQQALGLLGTGRVRPSQLVSDRFPLSEAPQALERLRDHPLGKVLVYPEGSDRD